MDWGLMGIFLALLLGLGFLLYKNHKRDQLAFLDNYHFHRVSRKNSCSVTHN